jgi:ribonuclease HI
MKLTIFIDGASRNNPGPAGIGVVIKKEGRIIKEVADYVGKTTNNVAEYLALIRGLEEALILGAKEVECYTDSELLAKQISGEYQVKNEGLIPLAYQVKTLAGKFSRFSLAHKVREENKLADQLANRGIDDQTLKGIPLFNQN